MTLNIPTTRYIRAIIGFLIVLSIISVWRAGVSTKNFLNRRLRLNG